jgi:hypothetical protein
LDFSDAPGNLNSNNITIDITAYVEKI